MCSKGDYFEEEPFILCHAQHKALLLGDKQAWDYQMSTEALLRC